LSQSPESPLEALLALQALDTELDRCRHRRSTLPERAEIAALDTELVAIDQRLVVARAARQGVAGDQDRMEQTLAGVEHRAAEIKKRLYGGTVSATRELQAMSTELDSLTARASELESRVLEIMEEHEPLDERVTTLEADRSAGVAARRGAGESLTASEAQVDGEIDVFNTARAEAARAVPPELIATYEQLRHKLGGVGVARLVGSLCGGCFLTLPAIELAGLRHQAAGMVSYCDQCGRILVPARR
jgi:predicted  nucleic acid-binding Zn-ribbon protein